MFCKNCGTQLSDDSKFCDNCGYQTSQSSRVQTQSQKPRQSQKKPGKKKLLILLSAIVLLAVAAVAVYYFCFTETVYLMVTSETDSTLIRYEYDRNGFLVSEELDRGEYHEVWNEQSMVYEYYCSEPDGKIDRVKEYTYDRHGNLTCYSDKVGSKGDILKYDYDYEWNGEIDSCKVSSKVGDPTKYRFSYDSNGNIKKVTSYDTNGEVSEFYQEYDYDKSGRLIRKTIVKREGTFIYEFAYDQNGHLKTYTDSFGSEIHFSYDKKGNLTSAISYDDDLKTHIREYSYDQNGNLIEYIDDPITSEATTYTFEYDKHGNVIAMETNGADRIEYTYKAVRVSKSQAEKLRSYNGYFWGSSCFYDHHFSLFYIYLIPTPIPDPFAAALAG